MKLLALKPKPQELLLNFAIMTVVPTPGGKNASDHSKKSLAILDHTGERLFPLESPKRISTCCFFSTTDQMVQIQELLLTSSEYFVKSLKRDSIIFKLTVCSAPAKKKVFIIKNICNFISSTHFNKIANAWAMKINNIFFYKMLFQINLFFWEKFKFNFFKLNVLSLSGLAFYSYRTFFYSDAKNQVVYNLFPKEDKFIRKSYFGGRCEIFKHLFFEPTRLYFYDFNSFYPYIMKNYPMPANLPKIYKEFYLNTLPPTERENIQNNFFGFAKITFITPKTISLPILPVRENSRMVFPIGTFIGTYFSEEINLAKTHGYKIIYHEIYDYNKQFLFNDYVNFFYNEKCNTSNPLNQSLGKACLNTLYGAFGLDSNKKMILMDYTRLADFKPSDLENIVTTDLRENHIGFGKELKSKGRNVGISSAISAYARISLYAYMLEYEKQLVYVDTDSLVLTKPINSASISSSLGALKKVHTNINDGIFMGPKFYALKFKKEQEKLIVKGFNATELNWSFNDLKKQFLREYNNITSNSALASNSVTINLVEKNTNKIHPLTLDTIKRPFLKTSQGIFTKTKNVPPSGI